MKYERAFGRAKFRFVWSGDTKVGRFGAGWNYRLGFALGGRTLMLELLVCYVVLSLGKPHAVKGR